jgi:hypothetical protein
MSPTTSTEDMRVTVEKTKNATHCVKRGERPVCVDSPVSGLMLGSDMMMLIRSCVLCVCDYCDDGTMMMMCDEIII